MGSLSPLAGRLQSAQSQHHEQFTPQFGQKPAVLAPFRRKRCDSAQTSFLSRSKRVAKERPNIKSKLRLYVRENREAAHIILADRERYAGLLVEWAELFLQEHPE